MKRDFEPRQRMPQVLVSLSVIAVLPCAALAQGAGTWQGTWTSGPDDGRSFECVLDNSSNAAVCAWTANLSAFGLGNVTVSINGTYSYDQTTDHLQMNASSMSDALLVQEYQVKASFSASGTADGDSASGSSDTVCDVYHWGVLVGRHTNSGSWEARREVHIVFVDARAGAANNGSSWRDACRFLQDALVAATGGVEIHVARGVYKPDQGVGIAPADRAAISASWRIPATTAITSSPAVDVMRPPFWTA